MRQGSDLNNLFHRRKLGQIVSIGERELVVWLLKSEKRMKTIARDLPMTVKTVKQIVLKFRETGSVADKPGRGRKRLTTEREDRMIVLMVRLNRHITLIEMKKQFEEPTGKELGRRRIINRLLALKYRCRRARKVSMLTYTQHMRHLR